MRKQYHFRPSPEGLRAWDVQRLIELTAGLPVERVPLAAIGEYEEIYWFDGDREQPTCRKVVLHMKLIQEADLAYPIILSSDGRVMDGMHRVAKAHLAGHDTIAAVRFRSDPEPDHVGVHPGDLPYD